MKTCSKCGVPQEPVAFYKRSKSPDGLSYVCKGCEVEARKLVGDDGMTSQQRWNAKHPEYYKVVGEDGITSQQRWNAKNPEKVRALALKHKYGITPEDFDRMLTEQGGACALCKDTNKKWCVDHCHITGKVRAILCYCCNIAIGNLGDSPKLATAAAAYLTKHQTVASVDCPPAV